MGLYSKSEVLHRFASLELGWPYVKWSNELDEKRLALLKDPVWVEKTAKKAARLNYPDPTDHDADLTWEQAAASLLNH